MHAMILAAGRGERMRPLTDTLPKPLLAVSGRPLIQYHIEGLVRAGVSEIVINLAWKGDRIREALGDGKAFGVRIVYSDEGDRGLETAGGIRNALPLLGTRPFLLANGDVWTDYPYEQFRRHVVAGLGHEEGDQAHIVLVSNPPQHVRGDFSLDGDRVIESPQNTHTYAGIGVYSAAFFAQCPDGPVRLIDPLRAAIRARRLSGEVYDGRWFDVGTPQRLAEVDQIVRALGESGR